jgi:hypothetical protein
MLHSTSFKLSFNICLSAVFCADTDVHVFPFFQQHANKTHCHQYQRNKALRDWQIFDDLIVRGFEVMEADSVPWFPGGFGSFFFIYWRKLPQSSRPEIISSDTLITATYPFVLFRRIIAAYSVIIQKIYVYCVGKNAGFLKWWIRWCIGYFLMKVEVRMHCSAESDLALWRDKEGHGSWGSSCFHPVNYEAVNTDQNLVYVLRRFRPTRFTSA